MLRRRRRSQLTQKGRHEVSTESRKANSRILKLESVEKVTVRRREELMDGIKRRHAEHFPVWKETSRDNLDSLINDVKVAKAGSVKMSVEPILIIARFKEHVRAVQTPFNANVEQNVKFTGSMAKTRKIPESGRLIDRWAYSVNF